MNAAVLAFAPPKSLIALKDVLVILSLTLLIAVSAQIRLYLPGTPVPVTLQSLAILLAGFWGGAGRGSTATALYLALGAGGLPVFADLSGGLATLLGPTGGYLVGFLPVPAIVAAMSRDAAGRLRGWPALVATGLLAHAVIFAFGVPWLKFITGMNWPLAIASGLTPFLLGSLIKPMIAAGLAVR